MLQFVITLLSLPFTPSLSYHVNLSEFNDRLFDPSFFEYSVFLPEHVAASHALQQSSFFGKLKTKTGLGARATYHTHIRYCVDAFDNNCTVPSGVCVGGTCVTCTNNPNGWRSVGNTLTTRAIAVSGACNAPFTGGNVTWSTGVTLVAQTLGCTTGVCRITGPCPLVVAGSDTTVQDITFECTDGDVAISVVGTNVKILNVYGHNCMVFRASSYAALDITGFVGLDLNGNGDVIGALANTYGSAELSCSAGKQIVAVPMQGTVTSSTCMVVNLKELLALFGSGYETYFYHKYGGLDGVDGFYNTVIRWELTILVVEVLTMLIVHQDIGYVRALKRKLA